MLIRSKKKRRTKAGRQKRVKLSESDHTELHSKHASLLHPPTNSYAARLVADFHTETAPDAERHDRQAPPETSRTRPPPTTPTSHTTRSNGGTPNGATPPKIALITGEDTEAEAKGDYPARRTTTAALSAHTDGKCTSRHRTPRNAASEDRVAPSTRSSRMNAAEVSGRW
jgi:hypothetical protein